MDTSTSDLPAPPVKQLNLIDVSMVRDDGMKALIMLARSLDWNVRHKPNQPVVITSREGIERRIPTNTSIRMSVFQTHLSSIILHSALEPSAELMEAVIKATKPNREQQNRLRMAVGVSVQEHRRLAEEVAPVADDYKEGPLTQTINIQWEDPPAETSRQAAGNPEGGPADHGEHGAIVKQSRFLAIVQSKGDKGQGYVYESGTSDERIWEDGYIDYVCIICGAAYDRPKGVGSHRQVHVKAGDARALVQVEVIKKSKRRATDEEWAWAIEHGESPRRAQSSVIAEPAKVVDVPDISTFAEEPSVHGKSDFTVAPVVSQAPTADDTSKLERVMAILVPDAIEQIDSLLEENTKLLVELQQVKAERDKLRSDLQGLRDILGDLG